MDNTSATPKSYPSLYKRITRNFIVLTSLMFALFWGLIYFAEERLEVISLEHRLGTELSEYMTNYKRYGNRAQLPDEKELNTYWSETGIPNWLETYKDVGFWEHDLGLEDKHFLIQPHPSGTGLIYVTYKDDADDYLDEYEGQLHFFSFLIGSFFLVFVMFYGLYFVRTLSAPFRAIEKKIQAMSPDQPNFKVDTGFQETRNIEQILLENKSNIAAYFKREQDFSRFSSHELRTPIMVIQGSSELLLKVPELPPIAQKAIVRIDNAGAEMKVLTETFLLLGKQDIEDHHFSNCFLPLHLHNILTKMALHFRKQESNYQLHINNQLIDAKCCDDQLNILLNDQQMKIYAPASFIDIVISNLIKNAFSYAIGPIEISLEQKSLTMKNHHDGNDIDNAGYGCGLVIIDRICERMGWQFTYQNLALSFVAQVDFTQDKNID